MIELRTQELVGKGLHRECYVHPENHNLCIKVVVNGGEAETRREQAYYKLLKKKKIAWTMLPEFYGEVETNLGRGAVFDLIRDSDGRVSRTLEHYLDSESLTELNNRGLQQSLCHLKDYLIAQNIMTMTLKSKNIVYQKRDGQNNRCIIIDNIGNSDFLPISSYNRFFGYKKITRKWARFMAVTLKRGNKNSIVTGQALIR